LLITKKGLFLSFLKTILFFAQVKKHKAILTFGEIIRDRRDNMNLSIREVATEINIDPSLLGKIERNERSPTDEQIELLADCLQLNLSDLKISILSDQVVYKIFRTSNEMEILKVAEKKVKYLKKNEKNTSI
jgi:transcriptional regulator with XRE-family HTH domain